MKYIKAQDQSVKYIGYCMKDMPIDKLHPGHSITHVAGIPKDDVQRCSNCGIIISGRGLGKWKVLSLIVQRQMFGACKWSVTGQAKRPIH